ncbi:venom carboxylesterase-6-like [Ctenocephalides felis]|uniref:venom carboxylesterase-6-like n=1 Tax=Ctenocephalides felis TaxID=7515 RepID=UPI000E6E5A25|nr:venom carboxylesterase-6-like [Ctenocephalides felis]
MIINYIFLVILISSKNVVAIDLDISVVLEFTGNTDLRCQAEINGTKIIGISRNFLHDWKKQYCAFLGIPYAKPPIGDLRFEPPVRNIIDSTYNETIEANGLKDMCVQKGRLGKEDCLYLNIYTPMLNSSLNNNNKTYPVMFWIHGGSFHSGSGTYNLYGPDYLVHEDVILVTFNYRLGVFGFLSAPEWKIYGNMGLKDQLLALQWVNENIEYFKGNKSSITLIGESAGAASVHYLMMSNLTKGLYHRAILQSGSALSPWAIQFVPEQVPTPEDLKSDNNLVFNPVVEHENSTNPIVRKNLVKRMYEGEFPDVNIIYGFNDAEGLLGMLMVNETNDRVIYKMREVLVNKYKKELPGVCHTDDLGYLFSMSKEWSNLYFTVRGYATIPEKAVETHKKMVTLWTNFAKTGNPLNTTTPDHPTYGSVSTINWEPYNNITKKYLNMNDTFEMLAYQEMDLEGLMGLEYKGQGWNDYKCNVAVRHRVIEGKYRTYVHDHGHHYCAYMGIPYAKPPTGHRRFLAPQE